MDHRLLHMLVCPICKGPLTALRGTTGRSRVPLSPSGGLSQSDGSGGPNVSDGPQLELLCPADRLAFPVRDGIPAMLESEARTVDAEDSAQS